MVVCTDITEHKHNFEVCAAERKITPFVREHMKQTCHRRGSSYLKLLPCLGIVRDAYLISAKSFYASEMSRGFLLHLISLRSCNRCDISHPSVRAVAILPLQLFKNQAESVTSSPGSFSRKDYLESLRESFYGLFDLRLTCGRKGHPHKKFVLNFFCVEIAS